MPDKEAPQVRQCNNPDDPEFGSVAVAANFGTMAWFVGRPGSGTALGGYWVPAGSKEDDTVQQWAPGTFPAYTPPAPEEAQK